MTFVGMVLLLGFILILPLGVSSVYGENSWNVFLNPYEGLQQDELFAPHELPISSGDTVTWINQDSVTHKITSGIAAHPDYSGEFFSTDVLSPGDNFSVSLENQGFAGYYYFCEIHPWFTGKIFFEDRPGMYKSTLDFSYDLQDSEVLSITGLVDSDLSTSSYEILIFDSKNNLIFQKIDSFEADATFDVSVDVSNSNWKHDENYVAKLVYGVPSESTSLFMTILVPKLDGELVSKSLEFCQYSESDFLFEDVLIPSWYSKSLCWFGNGLVVQKEVSDSLGFFQDLL